MTTFQLDEAKEPKALFVFMHGAGADMNASFMEHVTQLLLEKNISVLRFNFPYMDKRIQDGKRRPPDRMPKLVDALDSVMENIDIGIPLFIGGKSMGSRVAATWLSEAKPKTVELVRGYIALGYPFHPIAKAESLRLSPLMAQSKPSIIIQGERDKLGNKEEILSYGLPENYNVLFLEDGDHDLKPRVKSGFTHLQHIQVACNAIEEFIQYVV